jgi:hypothetical protein
MKKKEGQINLKKIIIEVEGGIVSGVYSDVPDEAEILIKDSDDQYDEHMQEYIRLQQLIDRGCVTDLMYPAAESDHSAAIQTEGPCMLDPNVFLLIREPNIAKTKEGKTIQRLHAAFIDGYLSAQAELFKFIMGLYRSHNKEDSDAACMISDSLAPLRAKQDWSYRQLCEFINQPGAFDEAGGESRQ